MKHCNGCDRDLAEESFAWKRKAEGTLQARCRECSSSDQKRWYAGSAGANHRRAVRENNQRRHSEKRQVIREIKEASPCTDCGVRYPYYVMDFDHLGDDKEGNVGTMLHRGGISLRRLLEEVAKCELVCANCHRCRTQRRRDGAPPEI